MRHYIGWVACHPCFYRCNKFFSLDLAHEVFDTFPHLDVSSPTWATSWNTSGEERCFDRFIFVLKGRLCKYACLYYNGGVITILKHPMKHTPLITFEGTSEVEICKLFATLISPNGYYQTTEPTI